MTYFLKIFSIFGIWYLVYEYKIIIQNEKHVPKVSYFMYLKQIM